MLCFPHTDGSPEKRQTVIPRMSFRFRFHMDKPAGSVFLSCKSRENFLLFAQSSEILPPGRADGFWLVDRQPLQEPAVFLSGQVPDLRRIPGPLEPPVIQTFIIEAESIFFKMQRLDPVAASPAEEEQGIAVGVQFIGIPDDCHQPVNALAHVRITCHQEKFRHAGQFP